MNIFTPEKQQQVLDNLFALATEPKSTNVSAIKLYLDLAGEQSPSEALTVDQVLLLLRDANQANEPSC